MSQTRVIGRAPGWVMDLVTAVCGDAAVEPPAVVRWRERPGVRSSGVTRSRLKSISVSAGSDPLDVRMTLLHELAHWISPAGRGTRRRPARHHGLRFYATAFALYRANGIPDAAAVDGESARYPSSLRHARVLGVEGADAAWRARRHTLAARPTRIYRVLVPEHTVRLARDGRWHICAVCRQRIVGRNLARLRWRGARARHVLLTWSASIGPPTPGP